MSRNEKPRKPGPAEFASEAVAEVSHVEGEPAAFADATPVMAQYLEIKAANPDSLL